VYLQSIEAINDFLTLVLQDSVFMFRRSGLHDVWIMSRKRHQFVIT